MLPFFLQRKARQQEVCNKFCSDFRHIVQPRDKIKSTRGRQVHAKFLQGKLEKKKSTALIVFKDFLKFPKTF